MNVIQKFKSDKSFRAKAVIAVIILIMIWANGGEDKKEFTSFEQCNKYNTESLFDLFGGTPFVKWGGGDMDHGMPNSLKSQCENAGCAVAVIPRQISGINIADWQLCIPFALEGWAVSSIDKCGANLGKGVAYGEEGLFLCKELNEEEQQAKEDSKCNVNEGRIAKFLYPQYLDDCKMAYMAIVFGGGFAALLLLLVVVV